jgi:DNA-binding transcriptional regulator YhcF (GntR family)
MGEGASLPTVWRHAIADPEAGLTPTQKLVALVISAHMNGIGEAWPSVSVLAEECGLDSRTVKRARAALVTGGLLVVDLGGGRSKTNRYTAAIPGHQRHRLAEKGVHQRPETVSPASRNGVTRAPRSSKEVHTEGASPGIGKGEPGPDLDGWTAAAKASPWKHGKIEPNPATDVVAPEEVSPRG